MPPGAQQAFEALPEEDCETGTAIPIKFTPRCHGVGMKDDKTLFEMKDTPLDDVVAAINPNVNDMRPPRKSSP